MMRETFQAFEFHHTGMEVEKKDFVLVSSERNIVRKRYLTMVSGYTESEMKDKIKKMKKKISFHYQAGVHIVFHHSEVTFEPDKNKFHLNKNMENRNILNGCPLIVVFSHNQCFTIGMFHSQG